VVPLPDFSRARLDQGMVPVDPLDVPRVHALLRFIRSREGRSDSAGRANPSVDCKPEKKEFHGRPTYRVTPHS